jgi:hypothetical protein
MIIGLSGKLKSGKDSVFAEILKHSPRPWQLVKFADKLKQMTSIILNCTPADLESHEYKDTLVHWLGVTPRHILQVMGTEFGRNMLHPDIWVNSLLSQHRPFDYWCCTDVRFVNESEGIRKLGGLVIRINRNTNSTDTHLSETALDNYTDWDYVIDNNGTLEELKEKVKIMCLELDL